MTAELEAPCSATVLHAWVEDLTTYPSWLDIVSRAEAVDAAPDDPGPAWSVDLTGRLGPLARSKRLRMVRTTHVPPGDGGTDAVAVFERRELDGRSHSSWVMRAEVTAADGGSRLTIHLHYGGSLWGPVLERLLGDEISRSRQRLLTCVAGPPPSP